MKAVIAGAGGHARSVLDAARSAGGLEPVAATDPRAGERELDGVPVVGGDERLAELRASGVEAALLGVGGTGDNGPRARLLALLEELGFVLPPVVHASASVAPTARLGAGTVVLARAVVGPGAEIGRGAIVNSGAIVEHDCVLADHVHVASGAVLGGAVQLQEGAHVGLGATVLPGLRIGAAAIAGAGAVVVRDLAAGVVAVGVPAVPRRDGG